MGRRQTKKGGVERNGYRVGKNGGVGIREGVVGKKGMKERRGEKK